MSSYQLCSRLEASGFRSDLKRISGYFVANVEEPVKVAAESEDSNSDDDDDNESFNLDVSDQNTFMASSLNVASLSLKKSSVQFMEHVTDKLFLITGYFPFIDPWWSVTVYVNRRKVVVGYPSYKLRTDSSVASQGLVLLFLRACKVDDQHVDMFHNAIRARSLENHLTFENLHEYLDLFASKNEDCVSVAKTIKGQIQSGAGHFVWRAKEFMDVFAILPQLLPRNFKKLVSFTAKEKLTNLQQVLVTDLWILGFSNVLKKRFEIYGCEASLHSFYMSDLIDTIDLRARDGLHVYFALKTMCNRNGHMFVPLTRLQGYCHSKNLIVTDWASARSFLLEQEVTVEEELHGNIIVYLYDYWSAEKNVSQFFSKLWHVHQSNPWTLDVDFDCPLFSRVRGDPDQVEASKLICSKPVVVLSGKGGCGKTEVVSCVFKYAAGLLEMERDCDFDDKTLADATDEHERKYYTSQEARDGHKSKLHTFEAVKLELFDEANDDTHLENIAAAVAECCMRSNARTSGTTVSDCSCRGDPSIQRIDCKVNCEDELVKFNPDVKSCFPPISSDAANETKACSVEDESKVAKTDVLLVAPTGKAANLLGRRTGCPAYTLHQVIFAYNLWRRKSDGSQFRFSNVRALVVDESSLVAVTTFNQLLAALTHSIESNSLRKVVILGDVHQLPSIQPGNFLSDLYSAMLTMDCAVTLKTNHRAESQCIIDNAARITRKLYPIADPERHFHIVQLREMDESLSNARDNAIRKLFNTDLVKDDKTSQFIAFRRADCQAINEICCKHYVKHSIKNTKGRYDFQVGDKVCCTKNGQVMLWTGMITSRNKAEFKRLCNGEIFFITNWHVIEEPPNTKYDIVTLRDYDLNHEIQVYFSSLRHQCKLRHAWARTIHTFQGSEAHTIVYVVGSGQCQTWQHVYTAVTRGRAEVVIIGRESMLNDAIRTDPHERFTRLGKRLELLFAKPLVQEYKPFEGAAKTFIESASSRPAENMPSLADNHLSHGRQSTCSIYLNSGKDSSVNDTTDSGEVLCSVLKLHNSALSRNDGADYTETDSRNVDCDQKAVDQLSRKIDLIVEDVDSCHAKRVDVIDEYSDTKSSGHNISEFSDWSDSLDDAVNESLVNRGSFPSATLCEDNNNLSPSTPRGISILETPPLCTDHNNSRISVANTPKRTPSELYASYEPPSSKPRLMDSVGFEVSPLRQSIKSKLTFK